MISSAPKEAVSGSCASMPVRDTATKGVVWWCPGTDIDPATRGFQVALAEKIAYRLAPLSRPGRIDVASLDLRLSGPTTPKLDVGVGFEFAFGDGGA